MAEVAQSTIAMGVYNVVSAGGSCTAVEALGRMRAYGYHLEQRDVDDAIGELVRRSYAAINDAGKITVSAPGMVVTKRDRSGDGWSGWRLQEIPKDRSHAMRRL